MKSLNKCQKVYGRFCSITWNTELIWEAEDWSVQQCRRILEIGTVWAGSHPATRVVIMGEQFAEEPTMELFP